MKWLKGLAITIVALFVIVPAGVLILVGTTPGSQWTTKLALNYVLGETTTEVSYEQFEGRLLDNLTLRGVRLENDGMLLEIESIGVSWTPLSLLDQQLIIDELQLGELRISQKPSAATATSAPLVLPDLRFPISVKVNRLALDKAWLIAANANAPQLLVSQLNAQVRWLSGELTIRELEIARGESFVRGSATLTTAEDYPLAIDAGYQWKFKQDTFAGEKLAIDSISGSLNVKGALDGEPLQIVSQFQAENTPTQHISATVSEPLTDLNWSAQLRLYKLPIRVVGGLIEDASPQLHQFINPGSQLSSKLDISTSTIEVDNLRLTDIGPDSGELTLNGQWQHNNFSSDYIKSVFNVDLSYQALSLQPLLSNLEQNVLTITNGNLSVKGSPVDYEFSATNQLLYRIQEAEQPVRQFSSELTTIGSGSLEHLAIETMKVSGDDLNLTAAAEVRWKPELAVRVDIAEGVATLRNEAQSTAIDLSGGLRLTNDVISAEQLVLQLGESRLQLNGTTAGPNQVSGELSLNSLQQLPGMPAASQELRGLELEFALAANDQLNEFDLLVKRLSVDTESTSSWSTNASSSFQLSQQDGLWMLESESLCLQHDKGDLGTICSGLGSGPDSFSVQVTGEQLSLRLINRLRDQDVAQRVAGHVALNAQAELARENFKLISINASLISKDTVFFALDQETSTALESWEIDASGDADAIEANLTGTLSDEQGGLIGDFMISDLYNEQNVEGSFLFQLDDLAMLDWVIPGLRYEGGKATASLSLGGTLTRPQLQGDMEVYAETVGFAQTNLVFNQVRLALIDNPETQGELEILGQAKSGSEGWILLEGVAIPLEQEAYLAIEGRNFRALQLPTATVDISPDLRIHFKDQLVDITGTVDVPYAQITAPEFDNAVGRSADVVVTRNGERVSTAASNNGGIRVQAAVRVNLSDKVSVNAYGFEGKLAGSLELMEQPQRPITAVGSINVTEGIYTLYGQELVIDRGSFIYNGGDISNPGLNLRVKRDINSGATARNVSVGAQVGGTLVQPDFRLFSTPAMPDTEILSYLLVGRSMQSATARTSSSDLELQALLMLGAKGTEALGKSVQETFGFDEFGLDSDSATRETSFYIGKYLSPKLYVKYGIGLLDTTNTFLIRYQLTERLLIESMTSASAQGGDIFYTLEK